MHLVFCRLFSLLKFVLPLTNDTPQFLQALSKQEQVFLSYTVALYFSSMRFRASSNETVGSPDSLAPSAAIIFERNFKICSLFSKASMLITTMSVSPFLVI